MLLATTARDLNTIEIFGGYTSVGNFTIAAPFADTRLTNEGYPVVGYGNSWVNTVQFKNSRVKGVGLSDLLAIN
ncbi:MAG: hypothetical protein ACJAYV_000657 [Oleispira sp.]|jgi:hypothetical protein